MSISFCFMANSWALHQCIAVSHKCFSFPTSPGWAVNAPSAQLPGPMHSNLLLHMQARGKWMPFSHHIYSLMCRLCLYQCMRILGYINVQKYVHLINFISIQFCTIISLKYYLGPSGLDFYGQRNRRTFKKKCDSENIYISKYQYLSQYHSTYPVSSASLGQLLLLAPRAQRLQDS